MLQVLFCSYIFCDGGIVTTKGVEFFFFYVYFLQKNKQNSISFALTFVGELII